MTTDPHDHSPSTWLDAALPRPLAVARAINELLHAIASQLPDGPVYRIIFAVDVKGSTERTNLGRMEFRETIYKMVEKSLLAAGITERHRDPLVDRGDGMLALIHQTDKISKPLVLTKVIPHLREQLRRYSETHLSSPLQVRAVLHAGDVHRDQWGPFGEDLDVAFRLLDAPEVKQLRSHLPDPLFLVISETIYWSIVSHDYPGTEKNTFTQVTTVNVRNRLYHGWAAKPPVPAGKFNGEIESGQHHAHRTKRIRRIGSEPLALD